MYDNLLKFHIPYDTPEWHQFRTTGIPGVYAGGIGASESGKLLGLDKYPPSLPEFFHQKIGSVPVVNPENVAMEKGLFLEPHIAEMWCYWKGNNEKDNREAIRDARLAQSGHKVRKMRENVEMKCYLVNPKYPWLFVSLDRAIPAGQPNAYSEILESPAPLEIKCIGLWQAEQWDLRIPPKYTVQIHQQMLVTESKYGEIIMWEDGLLRVYSFHYDQRMVDAILSYTHSFWQRVLHARELYALLSLPEHQDETSRNQIWGEIQRLEPEPDASEAYKDYLSARMTRKVDAVKGSAKDYMNAKRYVRVNLCLKQLEAKKTLLRNELVKSLVDQDARALDFGHKYGKVVFGDKFNVYVKQEIDYDKIEREMNEIAHFL